MRQGLIPGVNVDKINVKAGLLELQQCGYPTEETERYMLIGHCLMLWARGEETTAQRAAIDPSFYGIDLTSWLRVLANARAHAE